MSEMIRRAVLRWNVITDRPTSRGWSCSISRTTVAWTDDCARIEIGDRHLVMAVDVARQRRETTVRHTHRERRRVLETVGHREQQDLHRAVPCSRFRVPGSCSWFRFDVPGSRFEVRHDYRARTLNRGTPNRTRNLEPGTAELLCFATERTASRPRMERLSAVPAEAGRRGFARA